MVGKYKVITLCGSTKFKDEFLREQKRLTLEGNIVISVGLFGHSGDAEVWTENTKEMLDDMHKRKIDMADEIFVINVNGYIGESTKSEIKYAQEHNKEIHYLEPPISTIKLFEIGIRLLSTQSDKESWCRYMKNNYFNKFDSKIDLDTLYDMCCYVKYDWTNSYLENLHTEHSILNKDKFINRTE